MHLDFLKYKRSYVFLRNPHFCLSNQFLLKQCWAPSMVQFANVQKIFFGKKSLNVSNVKILSKNFFNIFGFFMPFWWKWQLPIWILSHFHGIKNLNGLYDLNSLNNLSNLNDLNSLILSKNLYFKVKMYIFDGLLNFIAWKRPLKVKILREKMNLWCFPF